MTKTKKRGHDFYTLPKREILLAAPATEYLSLLDAAQLTRLSPWTLRELIKKGELRGTRIGRRLLITREAIREMMEKHTRYQPQRA